MFKRPAASPSEYTDQMLTMAEFLEESVNDSEVLVRIDQLAEPAIHRLGYVHARQRCGALPNPSQWRAVIAKDAVFRTK